jgi:hypothetical protein
MDATDRDGGAGTARTKGRPTLGTAGACLHSKGELFIPI